MLGTGRRWGAVVREGGGVGYETHRGPEGDGRTADTADSDTNADAADELFALGERCAETYMQADALHYEAMVLLAEFDERKGYAESAFPTTADWLAWRIGIKPGPARERVRTARALQKLPLTSEAMENGELSFTKVRALTRVARPETEETLLEYARAGSAANLERMVRGWKVMDRKSEITAEEMRHRRRRFSAYVDEDGMVVVRGRLDPEAGALLMRALDQAGDVLFREASKEDNEVEPEHQRADALGLICSQAMKVGFGTKSGSKAERYQVMLHVDEDTLKQDKEPGQSELADGTRVSAETSRRISCDCSVVRVRKDESGSVLDVGRRTRTIPPSLRRALEARDRGCRFPGCGIRYTDGHHVLHWADGGETSLRNVMLLCPRHHRAVHEGGTKVCMDKERNVVFFEHNGRALFDTPRGGGVGGEPVGLEAESADGGLADGDLLPRGTADGDLAAGGPADAGTSDRLFPRKHPGWAESREHLPSHRLGAARWARDSDIPYDLEAKAWEALDSGGPT
ncbi:MAG: DUF222 domain-containing protein [Longimicrobiales bacterium]